MKKILLVVGLAIVSLFALSTGTTKTPPDSINTPPKDRTIVFKGEVNDASADDLIGQLIKLDDGKKQLYLVINSPGGSIDAGARIEAAIDATKSPLTCIVDGEAASMAAGIFLHCPTRVMQERADLMFHEGSMSVDGEREEVLSRVAHYNKLFQQMDKDNADHLHMKLDDYMKKVDHEWWLCSDEALKVGATQKVIKALRYDIPAPPPKQNGFMFPF